MGHGVALGPEFQNCTRTHGTCGYDTMELPVPVLYPKWTSSTMALQASNQSQAVTS